MRTVTHTGKRAFNSIIQEKKEKESLKKWRPVSLLNSDYKILTHVLANKLKGDIHKIIQHDQNGYIKEKKYWV